MFKVQVDVARGLFETAISGFWSLGDVDAFGRAVAAAARQVADATRAAPVSVCDYREAGTQSREVAAALEELVRDPPVRSRRIAIIATKPLAKIQARRLVATRPEFRFFDTPEAGRAWVLERPPELAAA